MKDEIDQIKTFFKILATFGECYDKSLADQAKNILKIYEYMEKNPNFKKLTENLN